MDARHRREHRHAVSVGARLRPAARTDPGDGVAEYRKLEKKHGVVAGAAIAQQRRRRPARLLGARARGRQGRAGSFDARQRATTRLAAVRHTSGRGTAGSDRRSPTRCCRRPGVARRRSRRQRRRSCRRKCRHRRADPGERAPRGDRRVYRRPASPQPRAHRGGGARPRTRLSREQVRSAEEKERDVNDLVAYIYDKDPPEGDKPWQGPLPRSGHCSTASRPSFVAS